MHLCVKIHLMTLQNFHHQITGKKGGPWLVFLHGLLGSTRNWMNIVPAFEENWQVLNIDQRGHGKSIKRDSGYAPQDFAQDLKEILSELKISEAVLVGHSMGGRNALTFTSLFPQMVKKLVLEDI